MKNIHQKRYKGYRYVSIYTRPLVTIMVYTDNKVVSAKHKNAKQILKAAKLQINRIKAANADWLWCDYYTKAGGKLWPM